MQPARDQPDRPEQQVERGPGWVRCAEQAGNRRQREIPDPLEDAERLGVARQGRPPGLLLQRCQYHVANRIHAWDAAPREHLADQRQRGRDEADEDEQEQALDEGIVVVAAARRTLRCRGKAPGTPGRAIRVRWPMRCIPPFGASRTRSAGSIAQREGAGQGSCRKGDADCGRRHYTPASAQPAIPGQRKIVAQVGNLRHSDQPVGTRFRLRRSWPARRGRSRWR